MKSREEITSEIMTASKQAWEAAKARMASRGKPMVPELEEKAKMLFLLGFLAGSDWELKRSNS